ncbi:MAG: sugar phosphate isomerase/epimerase [Bacteroidota bacterium]
MTAFWAMALSQAACASGKRVGDMGIQLYTVRDDMEKDPIGTLEKLSQMGYEHVESAGFKEGQYYGMSPKAFKKVLDDLGLTLYSGHNSTGTAEPELRGCLYNDWELAVASAAEAGQQYMVIAYLQEQERQSLDDYKKVSEQLNVAGEMCKKYGLQLAYHNHDFEFEKFDGQIAYDVMLDSTEAELLAMELDLYWITKAQYDPFAYFEKYEGRFPLWHVKDMDATAEQFFTEVGNGIIDWEPIFRAAQTSGMQHFFVEQDQCKNHQPLESVAISLNYLTAMRY